MSFIQRCKNTHFPPICQTKHQKPHREGAPCVSLTIGRCVGRCFVRSPEHTSLFQPPVCRPFTAGIVRWGGHTRNTAGKAEACINIRSLHKHAHEYPLLTLPEAKQGFASSKPPFCFILKTLELRANFQCITMQNKSLNRHTSSRGCPPAMKGDGKRVPGKHRARIMQARCFLQADAKPA